jgi:hypothetical protein
MVSGFSRTRQVRLKADATAISITGATLSARYVLGIDD